MLNIVLICCSANALVVVWVKIELWLAAASSLVALQSRMMGSAPYKYNSRSIKDEPQWDLGYYDVGMREIPIFRHC